jgi:ribokinase
MPLRRHCGCAGAFAFHSEGQSECADAEPIRPVDTTGAGDTFAGVLTDGLDEAMPFASALQRAVRAASLACLAQGAQAGMPTREQLGTARAD